MSLESQPRSRELTNFFVGGMYVLIDGEFDIIVVF